MRFDSTGRKVFKHLRFSEILNLYPYMRNKSANAIPRLTYSLTSVVAHIGSSIDSGHYITAAKESTGEFYIFNDSQVQPTSLSNVLELESYILIFERVPSEGILQSVRNFNNKDNNKVAKIPPKQQNIPQAPKTSTETSKVQDKRNTFEEEGSSSITYNRQNTTNANQDDPVITGEDDVGNSWRQLIIAAALVALCLDLTDLMYKPKEYWERPLFQMRKQCGFYHTSFHLLKNDEAKFENFTRMSITQFTELKNIIAPTVEKNTFLREPISAEERLLVTLRYLAIGDNQISLSYLFNISPTAISNIVGEVCEAIWQCLSPIVSHEQTEEDWLNISADFAKDCHFPHCIGAIDGKHVTIQAPANAGSEYYNYKGHHSIVLLAACDANYVFRFVDIGAPGRQSDGGVFTKSNIWKLLECFQANIPQKQKLGDSELPYVFVGDSAFPLSDYLLTPFPASWNTSVEKRIYNYRHAYARGRIENTFGILASKWRIYRRPINYSINVAVKIVKSTVCLHNWLRMSDLQSGNQMYITPTCVDRQSENGTTFCTWRKIHGDSANMLPCDRISRTVFLAGIQTRQAFCDYFNGEGSLPWQHRYV